MNQVLEHRSAGAAQQTLLEVKDLGISFGGLKAVQNFNLTLPSAGLYGLIGPNGAGKTTVFNLLTGIYQPQTGSLSLNGKHLLGCKPHEVTAAGIARTFQNIRLFPNLSILDNVRLAGQIRIRPKLLSTFLRTNGYREQEAALKAQAMDLLEIFDLQDRAEDLAQNLSYGHQRRLEIIRALATKPSVLLLDEPAAGLNPQEKLALAQSIRQIRDRFEVAILLIEHDMQLVMDICERIVVLDHGVTICEGTPQTVQNDEKVIAAYLGAIADDA
ncbi:Lipopolysaccharide export system ATP-binding protein LptB [Planctopirus ephydatiae]|uniref:Lipopolysaccharide export system ATP-binding protein LptB n=1 Tax=Planctopirus ephydatiae TaxID=2528019 RepID=A0A518GRC3_9PLAN|nr:ABC transporter ATP-binding protein [Planctopirus ephydatiae]QDV31147.1 Lipopolysaccharide export system ATP-binding protein LptB [Planctopirus ephydatiae]